MCCPLISLFIRKCAHLDGFFAKNYYWMRVCNNYV